MELQNNKTDETSRKMDSVDILFDKFQIDFSNYKFDRNEANARYNFKQANRANRK